MIAKWSNARIKILVTVLAIVAPLGTGAYFAVKSELFKIKTINVEVANQNDLGSDGLVRDIKEALTDNVQSYLGRDIWSVTLDDLKVRLQKSSWVADSEIHRQLPDGIHIRVQLKPISTVLVNEKGQLLPVSSLGELMEPVSSNKVPNVPVLVGTLFEKNDQFRKKAVQMVADIPNTGMFSKSNISEVHYKPQDGFWVTMIHSGLQIKLGEEQIGLKSERVAQVLEYIQTHSLDARVIDANLSKKVLVRLRKEP